MRGNLPPPFNPVFLQVWTLLVGWEVSKGKSLLLTSKPHLPSRAEPFPPSLLKLPIRRYYIYSQMLKHAAIGLAVQEFKLEAVINGVWW